MTNPNIIEFKNVFVSKVSKNKVLQLLSKVCMSERLLLNMCIPVELVSVKMSSIKDISMLEENSNFIQFTCSNKIIFKFYETNEMALKAYNYYKSLL